MNSKEHNQSPILQTIPLRKLIESIAAQFPMVRGSTVALITPFTSSGNIDVQEIKSLVQFHIDQGTDNFCILGTTAEAAVMSLEERATVISTVVEIAKGKVPILVGTGTINPSSVKAMTQQAIDLGADANLVVSPYYIKPPQRGLIRHFVQIADMGLPVVLYDVPGRTAVRLSEETIGICAEHDNIFGLKDATGDISRIASLKTSLGKNADNFLLYSGDDGTTLDFCLNGGDGCISVTANVAPKTMHEMVHAALNGNTEIANQLNGPLESLHKDLFVESNPIPCKWAAKRMGLIKSAYCRPPLDELDPPLQPIVEAALKGAGLIQ